METALYIDVRPLPPPEPFAAGPHTGRILMVAGKEMAVGKCLSGKFYSVTLEGKVRWANVEWVQATAQIQQEEQP